MIFFTKNPYIKTKFFGVVVGGWGRVEGRCMDRRTGPNQFAPSTSSKLGA